MIEIIATLTGLLFSSVKSYLDGKDLRKKREFGKAITGCYLRLLEVTRTSWDISSELAHFADSYKRKIQESADPRWAYKLDKLLHLLHKQSINLIRLGKVLQPLEFELRVLNPDIAMRLAVLVRGKKSVIRQLAQLFSNGYYPYAGELIEKGYAFFGDRTYEEISQEIRSRLSASTQSPIDDLSVFRRALDVCLVDDDLSVNSLEVCTSHYEQMYENAGNASTPGMRFEELVKSSEQLRRVIVENFQLEDILWSVWEFQDDTETDSLA